MVPGHVPQVATPGGCWGGTEIGLYTTCSRALAVTLLSPGHLALQWVICSDCTNSSCLVLSTVRSVLHDQQLSDDNPYIPKCVTSKMSYFRVFQGTLCPTRNYVCPRGLTEPLRVLVAPWGPGHHTPAPLPQPSTVTCRLVTCHIPPTRKGHRK